MQLLRKVSSFTSSNHEKNHNLKFVSPISKKKLEKDNQENTNHRSSTDVLESPINFQDSSCTNSVVSSPPIVGKNKNTNCFFLFLYERYRSTSSETGLDGFQRVFVVEKTFEM